MDNNTIWKPPSSSSSSSLIKTNTAAAAAKKKRKKKHCSNGTKSGNGVSAVVDDGDQQKEEEEDCGDVEAWDTLSKSFRQVQAALDQNRDLIQRANDNHQSKIPDNLAMNVGLINEINGNISKVLSIYSDLSLQFSDIVHQHHRRNSQNGAVESAETGAEGADVDED